MNRALGEPRRGDNIIKLAGLNITQPSLGAMMPPTCGAASKRNELPVCGGQHDASRQRPAAASQVKITALFLGKTATSKPKANECLSGEQLRQVSWENEENESSSRVLHSVQMRD
jgi:hypothetical protein